LLCGLLVARLTSRHEFSAWLLEVCESTRMLVSGDVVDLGDTLVLETSAIVHESSTLSIPTK
jgi:hypothetical protein